MWKTRKGLFANRTFEASNIHTKYLKKRDNRPGITSMTMQHANIPTALTTIYVMNNTGISRNQAFSYIVNEFGNNYHVGNFERRKPEGCVGWRAFSFSFRKNMAG